jgi:hypothetical protein
MMMIFPRRQLFWVCRPGFLCVVRVYGDIAETPGFDDLDVGIRRNGT